MGRSRTATAAVGIVASLAISVARWWYFDSFVFFVFVPFVPVLLRDRDRTDRQSQDRECPACGFRTAEECFEYCPRDGTRLR